MEKFEDFTHTDELKNLLLSKSGKLRVDVDVVLSELQQGKQLINILNNVFLMTRSRQNQVMHLRELRL
jgi:hypothetical protein